MEDGWHRRSNNFFCGRIFDSNKKIGPDVLANGRGNRILIIGRVIFNIRVTNRNDIDNADDELYTLTGDDCFEYTEDIRSDAQVQLLVDEQRSGQKELPPPKMIAKLAELNNWGVRFVRVSLFVYFKVHKLVYNNLTSGILNTSLWNVVLDKRMLRNNSDAKKIDRRWKS